MKVISIVGARPQFIKAALVSRQIRQSCQEILLHTGQHYDTNMSGIFFEELGLTQPEIQLGIGSGSHAEQTGKMMMGIEAVIVAEKPDWLLVYGDTNSTLAGALAATKLHVPVAHVEAGLRSFNRAMPEEINRILVDHVSSALFCPTETAVSNLAVEGIRQGVHLSGDVMGDALNYFLPLASSSSRIMDRLQLQPKQYVLATIHRAGNTDDSEKLMAILNAFARLPFPVVFPVHPRTRKVIEQLGIHLAGHILLIDPVGYLDMLWLEANADGILTDSGGVQKEAYWLGIRCITLRDDTEWVETVQAGWNWLVGADPELIQEAVLHWHPVTPRPAVFGMGQAVPRIVQVLTGANSDAFPERISDVYTHPSHR